MIDLDFTNEELEALKEFKSEKYEAINQMLVSNCETDIALLSDEVENKVVSLVYDRENVIESLKIIKLVYSLILKQYYKTRPQKLEMYRGTNIAEIERFKSEPYIDKILSATDVKEDAENKYAAIWNRPASMNIKLDNNVPYIYVDEVLKSKKKTNEILIAPFTKIKSITVNSEKELQNNLKLLKIYDVEIEKQELDELTDRERNGLYNYILENAYSIRRKLDECINLEKENSINFENIRKLEQLLAKKENLVEEKESTREYSDIDREADFDDIARINKELDELKEISTNIFEVRKENINFINMWKRNIAVYMLAECREIEKKFDDLKLELQNENDKKQKEIDEEEIKETASAEEDEEIKEKIDETKVVEIPVIKEETKKKSNESELYIRVKSESKENVESGEKLLSDIKELITKQQNHAKIAGNLGSTYSALNNAFEMRQVAETLLDLLKNINLKVAAICEQKETLLIKEQLEKISKINIEISTLINYLNNPKIAVRNSTITRFDEMAIIEENELKRGIAEKIRYIRGEAELKKLKDDLEIIEDKGSFSRFLGIFTGKNKLDDFMIEQIETRQRAIRKTLSKKLSLAHNYSIHELMAEIEMFVEENEDDELVEDDVTDLKALGDELKRNYIVLESKVQSIIEEKDGRNLPVDDRKLSKMEMIEIETYRFLNKYGYDLPDDNTEEPKYQDTMASEISRIVEYINSSNIL